MFMKTHKADDEDSIRTLLDYLNHCHDGFVRRFSFVKNIELTKDGNVILSSSETLGKSKFEIEVELLLNSYVGASPPQIVMLKFEDTSSFRFCQDNKFVYSDIYEVNFCRAGKYMFEFSFCKTQEKIEFLNIACRKVVCREM